MVSKILTTGMEDRECHQMSGQIQYSKMLTTGMEDRGCHDCHPMSGQIQYSKILTTGMEDRGCHPMSGQIQYSKIHVISKNDRLQITSDYMKKCNRLQLITITNYDYPMSDRRYVCIYRPHFVFVLTDAANELLCSLVD